MAGFSATLAPAVFARLAARLCPRSRGRPLVEGKSHEPSAAPAPNQSPREAIFLASSVSREVVWALTRGKTCVGFFS